MAWAQDAPGRGRAAAVFWGFIHRNSPGLRRSILVASTSERSVWFGTVDPSIHFGLPLRVPLELAGRTRPRRAPWRVSSPGAAKPPARSWLEHGLALSSHPWSRFRLPAIPRSSQVLREDNHEPRSLTEGGWEWGRGGFRGATLGPVLATRWIRLFSSISAACRHLSVADFFVAPRLILVSTCVIWQS